MNANRAQLRERSAPNAIAVSVRLASLLLGLGCAARAEPARAVPSEPAPPLPAPGPGASGCVESRELKDFVQALAAERQRARAAALAALGATERQVPSEFASLAQGLGVGQTYERAGRRFAVVAQLAVDSPPSLALAVQGNSLHPLAERPQGHALPLLVCGVSPCPKGQATVLPPVRALGVELAPGEVLGAPLALSYDYWWAQVSYDQRRECPPQPAPKGEAGARAAPAAE